MCKRPRQSLRSGALTLLAALKQSAPFFFALRLPLGSAPKSLIHFTSPLSWLLKRNMQSEDAVNRLCPVP
jgi:hypothetical protein